MKNTLILTLMHTRLYLPQVQCSDRDPLGFPDHLGTNQPWRHLWPLSRAHRCSFLGAFRGVLGFSFIGAFRGALGCSFIGSERHPDRGPNPVPDYGCPLGTDHVLAGPERYRSDDPYRCARSVAA